MALLDQTPRLLASGGQTPHLSVFVGRLGDPVDAGVRADGSVHGVDEDDFVVLVATVLSDPVGVEDAEASEGAAGTLLSDGLKAALILELVDTLSRGFTMDDTFGQRSLTASSGDSNSVNDEPLLLLISQSSRLVGSAGTSASEQSRQLSVLPAPDSEEESHGIRLFLPP